MSRSIRDGVAIALMASTTASMAAAAGIERTPPSTRVLFEEGRYMEFSLSYVDPDVSGTGGSAGPGFPIPGSTGNILKDFSTFGAAYKADLGGRLSYALILDQPFGVSLNYPRGFYEGTSSDLETTALTGMLGYDVTPRWTVYGGLRAQRMEAEGAVPFLGGYTIETDTDIGLGYMAGIAYQRPEIALRVALSYYSGIEHSFDTEEFGSIDGTIDVETPQQVALEFQSGIAANTLIFGSVRWVDWPQFEIDPDNYPLAMPMVAYEDPWMNYRLGIGHQFNERLAGAFEVSYEPQTDTVMPALGPVDGGTILTASLSYDLDPFIISGGVSYGWLNSAENELGTTFDGGTLQGIGIRIGYRF